jgi:hypothetical protein
MPAEGEISWPTAVAILADERTRAESMAALLKKYGDSETIDRLSIRYNNAKATYDGVIGALIVALAQKKDPESLDDLQNWLRKGFVERQAFSNDVNRFLPPTLHQKGEPISDMIEGAVKGLVEPVLDAIKSIWFRIRDDNALMRKTIETQLNATRWLDFASVQKAA